MNNGLKNGKQVNRPPPQLEFEECLQEIDITIGLVQKFLKQGMKKIVNKSGVTTVIECYENSKDLINEKINEFEEFLLSLPQTNNINAKHIVKNIIGTLNEAKDNISKLITEVQKAKDLLKSFILDDKDAENKVITIFENVKTLAQQTQASLRNDVVKDGKKLEILSDKSEIYASTNGSTVYVEVIANYHFVPDNYKPLPGIKEDIKSLRSILDNKQKYELHIHENESNEETEQILDKWSKYKFEKNSSIVVVFDTHGTERHIITADGEAIPHSRIWQCFEKNPHLGNKPVLIIFEACRGEEKEQVVMLENNETKSSTFEHWNYSPKSQGFIIVYASAYACAAYAPKEKGSHFLQQFLPLLKDKTEWDLLAKITKTTQNVLYKIQPPVAQRTQFNQTVTYVNLLHKQWKLGSWTETTDNWSDVSLETYTTGEIPAILAVHDTLLKENSEKLEKLANVMKNCGIKICKTITKIPSGDEEQILGNSTNASAVLLLIAGLETKGQFTEKTLPGLIKAFNQYDKYHGLKGRPKLIFSLGTSIKQENLESRAVTLKKKQKNDQQTSEVNDIKATRVDVPRVTEHSDVLAYCDQADGWLEAMIEMFEHAAGNEIGLVRLLTRHVMSRQEALLSDQPPFMESTLLKKFVFQKKT